MKDLCIYKTAYCYGDDGYFLNTVDVQIMDGVYLPNNTTLSTPELKEGYWYKYNSENDDWIAEKIPTSILDLLPLTVKFDDNSERGGTLRKLMRELVEVNSDTIDYYVDKTDNIWSVKQYTEEYLFNRSLGNKELELSTKYNTEMTSCEVPVKISTGKTINVSTNSETIQTLTLALTMCSYGLGYTWIDDDGNTYKLTDKEDVLKMLNAVNKHNTEATELWGKYKQKIAKCTTRKQLDKIIINLHSEEHSEEEEEEK